MAKFLNGSELASELERIIKTAKSELYLISPYIKFHPHIVSQLERFKHQAKPKVIVVFGKNQNDFSKSLDKSAFALLSSLPNVEIHHVPSLHAKYYANENEGLLSSMNLYDYSQNNNIEFGVTTKHTTVANLGGKIMESTFESDAFQFFKNLKRTVIFRNEPNMVGSILNKRMNGFSTSIDSLSSAFVKSVSEKRKNEKRQEEAAHGYCIRTGEKIPFNPKRPFSASAFESWAKYGDESYSEKFCHFSGEKSKGETSMKYPILKKNWKQAQGYF